ncbi:MAG: hypothetical protein L6R41_008127 [Letrouitia leprolyta]|nr:MAG: hypothetical protein L6R41_008127 [Letrouitia leprolyta]
MPRKRGQRHVNGENTSLITAKQRGTNGLNDAYRDMLAEAEADSSPILTGHEGRPIKRRRVRGHIVTEGGFGSNQNDLLSSQTKPAPRSQITPRKNDDPASSDNNSSDSRIPVPTLSIHPVYGEQTMLKDEASDESDFAWEEVELAQEVDQPHVEPADRDEDEGLNLVLDVEAKKGREGTVAARRKPLTAIERKLRLEIHRVHLLCLLSHVHLRNHWCNDQNVHVCNQSSISLVNRLRRTLESIVPPATQGNCFTIGSRREAPPVSSRRGTPERTSESQRLF